jgi:hypothetical protein
MRRVACCVILAIILAGSLTSAAGTQVTLCINGTVVTPDVPPQITNGRVLVPIRLISETMGFMVDWDQNRRVAVVTTPGMAFPMPDLSNSDIHLVVNGVEIRPDVPPRVVDGRVLVPLRAVAEAFGFLVDWNQATQTASVSGSTVGGNTLAPIQSEGPPLAPIGVMATAGDSEVVIQWQPNLEPDVVGYYVYYALNQTDFTRLVFDNGASFASPAGVRHYGLPNGTPCYYYVTAVDIDGNESGSSLVVMAIPAAFVVAGNEPTPPETPIPEPPSSPLGPIAPTLTLYLVGDDGKFLGELTTNEFHSDGIFNEFGPYGSKFSSTSIWNEFGRYGSDFSTYSAFNEFASKPPLIVTSDGAILGKLTTNRFISGAISPYVIYAVLHELGR